MQMLSLHLKIPMLGVCLSEVSRMAVATALQNSSEKKRGDLMGNRERGGALCLGMPAKPH